MTQDLKSVLSSDDLTIGDLLYRRKGMVMIFMIYL